MKGRSTDNELFSINQVIHENLDDNKNFLEIFLDVKKAFDYINYVILFKKLICIGLRGKISELIHS